MTIASSITWGAQHVLPPRQAMLNAPEETVWAYNLVVEKFVQRGDDHDEEESEKVVDLHRT